MAELVVYTRRGCHLCEDFIESLLEVAQGRHECNVRDVDQHPEWSAAWGEAVPVLFAGGQEICRYRLDRERVLGLPVDV